MGGLAATLIVTSLMLLQRVQICACFDYRDALEKSIMFYEAQRSGRLPPNQRVTWRANSGLEDGKTAGVDLEGGYYDAGDNVKFGMPMAYTITMLSWSTVAYRKELHNARQLGYVGDGNTDHECWQRPEDMTTPRPAYRIDPRNPGSDLAGETAAAMAAASIAFRDSDASYSYSLLNHARQLFSFADTYRGKYDNSIQVAQKYYASKSGYTDELLWSAIWLYEATGDEYYLAYVANNAAALGGINWSMTEFSWDVKFAGPVRGRGRRYASTLRRYQDQAEYFLCACLQKSYGAKVQRTPGGLMFVRSWNNMQIYYLSSSRQQLNCHDSKVEPFELLELAKSQLLVGFGDNYPRQLHHRASSIVSYKVDSSFVSCRGGYATWYSRRQSDPNVLVGALVGGPDQNDNFADQRENYEQTEPATYNNGPMVVSLIHVFNLALPAGGTREILTSWSYKNLTYHKYGATIRNKSKQSTFSAYSQNRLLIWAIMGSYKMTTDPSIFTLFPGQSFDFVYIHAAPHLRLLL
ncbi:hypothetical protein O6H91_02G135100 [Diphasiastrum complanatum]|uniref:Uncharacterized protein n=1 Tax=Diphasiastrum complanatum TaxID=34168 RepID=A0ACC2EL20_DIPCM|nr:hypothetical protein O6H91_02G135100 [Diphasiastrum complanatum]